MKKIILLSIFTYFSHASNQNSLLSFDELYSEYKKTDKTHCIMPFILHTIFKISDDYSNCTESFLDKQLHIVRDSFSQQDIFTIHSHCRQNFILTDWSCRVKKLTKKKDERKISYKRMEAITYIVRQLEDIFDDLKTRGQVMSDMACFGCSPKITSCNDEQRNINNRSIKFINKIDEELISEDGSLEDPLKKSQFTLDGWNDSFKSPRNSQGNLSNSIKSAEGNKEGSNKEGESPSRISIKNFLKRQISTDKSIESDKKNNPRRSFNQSKKLSNNPKLSFHVLLSYQDVAEDKTKKTETEDAQEIIKNQDNFYKK